MASPIIVDTDILIDVGRNVTQAVTFLETMEQQTTVMISAVTVMELLVGCRNKREMRHLDRFLQRFHVLMLDPHISAKAIDLLRTYRLGHGLLIADALIAATAIVWGYPFVSKNQRHFRYIKELELLPYPPGG